MFERTGQMRIAFSKPAMNIIKSHTLVRTFGLIVAVLAFAAGTARAAEPKPHVVFVVGTLHYSPELSMPLFAQELERFGYRTTVVKGEGDPEKKKENVLEKKVGKKKIWA